MQRTKLRTMPSLDSGYFEHSPPSSSSPPPTDEEKMSVPTLAGEALDLLASQDCKVSFGLELPRLGRNQKREE